MQLQTLFTKLKKEEIAKTSFVRLMKGIVGDQMLRLALAKVQSQTRPNQGPAGQLHPVGMPTVGSGVRQLNDPHALAQLHQRSMKAASDQSRMTSSAVQTVESSARKSQELDIKIEPQDLQPSQLPPSSSNAVSQETERSSVLIQGLNKQQQRHLHFPSAYTSSGGNYNPFSGTTSSSTSSIRPQPHDSHMSQIPHQSTGPNHLGGATQGVNMIGVPNSERQSSFSDPWRVLVGSVSPVVNNTASQQTSNAWQSSTNKEQNAGLLSSVSYVKKEPSDLCTEQQHRLNTAAQASANQGTVENEFARGLPASTSMPPTTSTGLLQLNSASPSVMTQLDPSVSMAPVVRLGGVSWWDIPTDVDYNGRSGGESRWCTVGDLQKGRRHSSQEGVPQSTSKQYRDEAKKSISPLVDAGALAARVNARRAGAVGSSGARAPSSGVPVNVNTEAVVVLPSSSTCCVNRRDRQENKEEPASRRRRVEGPPSGPIRPPVTSLWAVSSPDDGFGSTLLPVADVEFLKETDISVQLADAEVRALRNAALFRFIRSNAHSSRIAELEAQEDVLKRELAEAKQRAELAEKKQTEVSSSLIAVREKLTLAEIDRDTYKGKYEESFMALGNLDDEISRLKEEHERAIAGLEESSVALIEDAFDRTISQLRVLNLDLVVEGSGAFKKVVDGSIIDMMGASANAGVNSPIVDGPNSPELIDLDADIVDNP